MAKAKKKASRKASKKVQRRKPKAKAKARTKPRPKHKFTVSHHRDEDFDAGLRTYAKYRDLGIAPATGGMVQAHVIKFVPPFNAHEVSTPHYHDVDFQMIYVLKGWIKSEFEGEGVHTFPPVPAGSSRRASSTPCSIIPTIAKCSRSCCRRISKR